MMDLYMFWRLEERYNKAGYKMENIKVGQELMKKVPLIRETFDMSLYDSGVFELEVSGVKCFLIKTTEAITFGTTNDICSNPGGTALLNAFLKKKHGTSGAS